MRGSLWLVIPACLALAWPAVSGADSAGTPTKTLRIYAAGSLAIPFQRIDEAFEKLHPDVVVRPQFGGSVTMARRIADLHQHVDVFASADYTVIPEVLGKAALASWFIGFSSNAVTLAYTPQSRGAGQINADNWYRIVAEPGVVIRRSDPNADPGGYRFVQMLSLASSYYHEPDLKREVLKNAPLKAVRDTKTSPVSALQLGQVDYLATYMSSAKSHHLKYLRLPAGINLSDPSKSAVYARGRAMTDKGVRYGKPIVYGVTVPGSADNPKLAIEYIHFLIGEQGRKILADSGFAPLVHPLARGGSRVPATLKPDTRAWPTGQGGGK